MKILYIINSFYWAGAEKLVYDLAMHMDHQANQIGVLAIHSQNNQTERDMLEALQSQGVQTYIMDKVFHGGRLSTVRKIVRIIRTVQPDLIHAHCLSPGQFAKLAGFFTGVPVVYTIHSTKGYPARQEQLSQWMVRRFVSIGESAQRYMVEELKLSPKKITRIYNGVDTAAFQSGKKTPDFWKPFGGQPGELAILSVARIVKVKNQLCQIRAIEECVSRGRTDIKLYLLGNFEPEDPLYQQLSAYVRDHGLEPYVHFLGMHSNVADYLANADCFVMTSIFEGLSVAFLEAVLAGKPIVVTELSFVRELEKMAPCATVIPQNDHKALAQTWMERAFQPPTPQTVELFRETFSMETFISKHMQLYAAVRKRKS